MHDAHDAGIAGIDRQPTRPQVNAFLPLIAPENTSDAGAFGIVNMSSIVVGMVHDWITRRRIHPVYTIEIIARFLFDLRLLAAGSATWSRIERPIIDALQ